MGRQVLGVRVADRSLWGHTGTLCRCPYGSIGGGQWGFSSVKFRGESLRKGIPVRSAILALLTLLVAVLIVACGGSDDGNGSTDEAEAVVAAEGQGDSGEQAEEPSSTGGEPANAGDTAVDEPAQEEPDGAATGGPSAATRAAFLDCLTEEGIELGGGTDGQAPVDEATAASRERCAEEAGLDPDLAGQRGGAGGFAGGGGFGAGGFGEGGVGGARILACLGEQGLSIDGIESLADLVPERQWLARGPGSTRPAPCWPARAVPGVDFRAQRIRSTHRSLSVGRAPDVAPSRHDGPSLRNRP